MYQSDDYYYQSNGQYSQVSRPAPRPMNKVLRYHGSQTQPRVSGGFNQYGGLDEPQDQFAGQDAYPGPSQDHYGEYRGSQDRFGGHDSFGGSQNQFSEDGFGGSDNQFGGPDEFTVPSNQYGITGGFMRPQEQYGASGAFTGPQGQNRSPGAFSRSQGLIRASGPQIRPRGGFNTAQGQNRPPNPYRAQGQRAAPGPQVRSPGQNRVNPYSRPDNQPKRQNSNFVRPSWNNQNKPNSQQPYNSSGMKPKFTGYNKPSTGYQDRFRRAPETTVEYTCSLCDVTCRTKFIFDQHLKGKGHQKKVKRKEIEKLWEEKDPSAYCSVCELALDPTVMDAHLRGEKHKLAIEKKTKGDVPSAEKEEEQVDEQKKDGKVSESSGPSRSVSVRCFICSIVIKTIPDISKHFNSREHMEKCAEKCKAEKKGAPTATPSTPAVTPAGDNPFYCSVCDITLTGQTPYDAHMNGYKHNYKVTKGKFDPSSPFFAKSMKRKEEMQRTKEKLEKRRLMRKAKPVKTEDNADGVEGENENGETENVEAAVTETVQENEGN